MGKSKVPFKTNVDIPIGKRSPGPRPAKPKRQVNKDGIWLRSRDRPIKAVVVNPKKERDKLLKWLLVWVLMIPVGFLVAIWLFLLFFDLFTL